MSNDFVRLGLMPPLSGLVGIYGSEIARAGQPGRRKGAALSALRRLNKNAAPHQLVS